MERLLRLFLKKSQPARAFRRHPRIFIAGESVRFQPMDGASPPIPVFNISANGAAFRQGYFKQLPDVDSVLIGRIHVDERSYPVELKVVHLAQELVGCAMAGENEGLNQAIEDKFRFEKSAHSLVKMNPEILKPVAEGTPYFYVGNTNEELYFVRASNVITTFNMSFSGYYIEGGRHRPLKMGKIVSFGKDKMHGPESTEIEFFKTVDSDVVEKAKVFLANVQWLSPDNIKLLCKIFKDTPRLQ